MFVDAQLYSTVRRRQKAPAAEEMENFNIGDKFGIALPDMEGISIFKIQKLNIQTFIT